MATAQKEGRLDRLQKNSIRSQNGAGRYMAVSQKGRQPEASGWSLY